MIGRRDYISCNFPNYHGSPRRPISLRGVAISASMLLWERVNRTKSANSINRKSLCKPKISYGLDLVMIVSVTCHICLLAAQPDITAAGIWQTILFKSSLSVGARVQDFKFRANVGVWQLLEWSA